MVANQIMRRLNCLNVLEDETIEYPFDLSHLPVEETDGWIRFLLRDLHEFQLNLPIRIPQIPDEYAFAGTLMEDALLNLFLGTYR